MEETATVDYRRFLINRVLRNHMSGYRPSGDCGTAASGVHRAEPRSRLKLPSISPSSSGRARIEACLHTVAVDAQTGHACMHRS